MLTLFLGLIAAGMDLIWPTTLGSATAEAILSPAELSDPALRDVVYRTQRHRLSLGGRFPFWVLGGLVGAVSVVGLLCLRVQPVRDQRVVATVVRSGEALP